MSTPREVLPSTVKPTHYDISLYDLEYKTWTYQGTVKITIQINEAVKDVVLNSLNLKIHSAQIIIQGSKPAQTTNVSIDEKTQQATLHFENALQAVPSATLVIVFSGILNNDMAGFYRSKYKPVAPAAASVPKDGSDHCMFSTQFESCDARQAFPCWDEPNLKATYDFEIEIPDDQVALSNMPEKSSKKGSKDDLKVVAFERTPVMSTYLLAWAFGDFEYVEDFTKREYNGKRLPVRVYTTKGLKEQGRFALENAHQVIDYFSELFRIDYPLPKSDLLAVHEFSHGAMENWGLVTYRSTAVLFDEANSDQKYKNRVAYVVAHELAHQWFGNLVTMDWWNELWLNEGFATFIGWYAIDHLYPEWNVWAQFVQEGYQTAFTLDALRNSHPIEVPVRDALDVGQIFDSISYLKGSSVIRMLSAHLTPEVFLHGVSNYLKKHAYGNATTNDLWSALSEVSGKNVNEFMDPWIRKIGFPVLTVAEEPGQIGIRQTRFLSMGDGKPEEDETTWWVPLGLTTADSTSDSRPTALTVKEDTLRHVDESFYKFNTNQTAFYRTNYPPARLVKLGEMKAKLSVQDRIGLIGDAGALAISGEGTTAGLLAFLEPFQSEDNYLVWSQIISSLANIRSIFASNATISAALRAFTLKLVTPTTDRLGWAFSPTDSYLTGQLRALMISTAGLAGHASVVAEAQRQFAAYTTGGGGGTGDRAAIHANLRGAVWRIAVTEGGAPAYEAVKREFQTTGSIDGRELALHALGRVQSDALAEDAFAFLLGPQVPAQDIHSGAMALAANASARDVQWRLIKENWSRLHAKIAGNPVVMDRYLRVSLNKFASRDVGQDIAKFFQGKDNRGWDRSLGVVADTIEGNAKYRERDEGLVLEWLEARGYVEKK